MLLLCDKKALSLIEYIVGGVVILAIVGMAIWNLAGAIAGRFNAFNNSL